MKRVSILCASALVFVACGQKEVTGSQTKAIAPSQLLDPLSEDQLKKSHLYLQDWISKNPGSTVAEKDQALTQYIQQLPRATPHQPKTQGYSDAIPQQVLEMNPQEKAICDRSASVCNSILYSGQMARAWVGYAVQGLNIDPKYVDNEGDAFRHSVWNALMTKYVGISTAKEFADAHEYGSRSQTLGSLGSQMDFYNNSMGRSVGNYYASSKDTYLAQKVIDKLVAGQLRIVQRQYPTEGPATGTTLLASNAYRAQWPSNYPYYTYFYTNQ